MDLMLFKPKETKYTKCVYVSGNRNSWKEFLYLTDAKEIISYTRVNNYINVTYLDYDDTEVTDKIFTDAYYVLNDFGFWEIIEKEEIENNLELFKTISNVEKL